MFSDVHESHRKKEDEALSGNPPATPENLFYMRQYVHNSCGTMALIHSILNNLKVVELKEGSVIKNFYDKAKNLTPEERGKLLEKDETFIDVHQTLAAEGQTAAPSVDDVVNNHRVGQRCWRVVRVGWSQKLPDHSRSNNRRNFLVRRCTRLQGIHRSRSQGSQLHYHGFG
jgi:Ubiquitin carboxyl-terminal hydrolase, family 1